MQITITTATPLNKSQRDRLVAAITKKHGSEMTIEEIVDSALIGGLQVTLGTRKLDTSIHTKLATLQAQLKDSSHA